MAEKNIEMNVMNESGGYDVLYPKNNSDITFNSEHLKDLFSLNENSSVDDAFDYISRKIILLQYNKAGVSVILKSQAGTPIPNIPILGITANYDGSGECITDENGTCFGYCDAGSVNIHCNTYVDMSINNQQLSVLASEMYNVELIASNFINFKKWTSSANNIRFSDNVSRIDVSVGGGGGGAGGGAAFVSPNGDTCSGGGGGGGYSTIQENVSFFVDTNYQVKIGAGGKGLQYWSNTENGKDGGQSSFLDVTANGGGGGKSSNQWGDNIAYGGVGNGNGGRGVWIDDRYYKPGTNGSNGTTYIYSSFTEQILYGGGGGSGAVMYDEYQGPMQKGIGGESGGGDGGYIEYTGRYYDEFPAESGTNGLGGGGGSGGAYAYYDENEVGGVTEVGNGGSGCVAIRIHLKITA